MTRTPKKKSISKSVHITLEQYNRLFEQQQGLCAGCYRHQMEFNKRLSVDHDHGTGKIRALLCHSCNLTLGLVLENPGTLRRLADYLDKHEER